MQRLRSTVLLQQAALLLALTAIPAWAVADTAAADPPHQPDKVMVIDAEEAGVEPLEPITPIDADIVVTPAPAVAAEQRAWLRPISFVGDDLASLDVRFAEETILTAPLVFEGELESGADVGPTHIDLVARDTEGVVRHTAELEVKAQQGFTPFRILWDLRDLPDGEYDVVIRAWQPNGFELSRLQLELIKFSWPNLLAHFESARELVAEVQSHVDNIGGAIPYPRMRLAVAKDYLEIAWTTPNDWRKLHETAQFASRVAESVSAQLVFNPEKPGSETSAIFDPEDVDVDAGLFKVDGRPVYFTGLHGLDIDTATIARLSDYGLNLAVERVAHPMPPGALAAHYDPIVAAAQGHRVGLAFVHDAPAMPDPALVVTDPKIDAMPAVAMPAAGAETLADYLEHKPNIVSLALAEAPVFAFDDPGLEEAFRELAIARYGDRHRLNRIWRTRLIELDEIGIWPDYDRASYQYDLQTFWRDLAALQMINMIGQARAQAPDVPMQILFSGNQFAPGTGRFTVEYERVAPQLPVSGLRVEHSPVSEFYAMNFPHNLVDVAYWRSIAPDAPVFTVENSLPHNPELRGQELFRFVYSLVWEGAVEGVGAYAMELVPGAYTYLSRPEGLEALATAHLDINRLAPVVAAFAQAPLEIGIVFSESSRLFENGKSHLDSAVRAYEGVSWGGMKVGFITESMLEGGSLPPLKVLVVPETPAMTDDAFAALQEILELPPGAPGPVVIRVAKPIPYTPWGLSRSDLGTFGRRAMLVRGEDLPTEFLHALDAGLANEGTFRDPRAINANNYILEGVRTRFVHVDGVPHLYLINLRKEPIQVHMNGGQYQTGRDLIGGHPVRFPTEVAPLTPMLLRIEPIDETDIINLDAETLSEFPIPTVRVEPVPAIPET